MENYKIPYLSNVSKVDYKNFRNYEKVIIGSNYNLNNHRQTSTPISTSESMYNNFMKFMPRGSHIGKYAPMENYKLETKELKYLSKDYDIKMMSLSYNLNNYRQKYTHISTAESVSNNFMKFMPTGSHIGKYAPLK